jgi:hypothetical protein
MTPSRGLIGSVFFSSLRATTARTSVSRQAVNGRALMEALPFGGRDVASSPLAA